MARLTVVIFRNGPQPGGNQVFVQCTEGRHFSHHRISAPVIIVTCENDSPIRYRSSAGAAHPEKDLTSIRGVDVNGTGNDDATPADRATAYLLVLGRETLFYRWSWLSFK